jgi:GNAT superfamily N-acetyltransferase
VQNHTDVSGDRSAHDVSVTVQPDAVAGRDVLSEVDIKTSLVLESFDVDALWPRYEKAFAPLRTKSATRMVMHRSEFEKQLHDPRIVKYVAYHDNKAVGLATLALDLHAVEWISPDYYAQKFPERFRQGKVYYLGWLLVDPEFRRYGLWHRLLQFGAQRVIRDKAMIVYDTCQFNEASIDFTGSVNRMLAGMELGQIEPIDRQMYYAWVPFANSPLP